MTLTRKSAAPAKPAKAPKVAPAVKAPKAVKAAQIAKVEKAAKADASRGRPAKRVFINVSVRETTRKSMNVLGRQHGMTQGELLDQLLAGKLQVH